MVRQDKFSVGSKVTELKNYAGRPLSVMGQEHLVLEVHDVPADWYGDVGHTQWLTVHFPQDRIPSKISGAYFNPL